MIKAILQGKWLKHPLHPILVHLPAGLWPAALVFDVLSVVIPDGNVFVRTSFYAILVGLIAALLAIPTGVADWWGVKREKPAWKIGVYHMVINLVVTLIFAANLYLRTGEALAFDLVPPLPLVLTVVGNVLLLIAQYLGGRMVYNYGISVGRNSKKKWRSIAISGGARVPEEKKG